MGTSSLVEKTRGKSWFQDQNSGKERNFSREKLALTTQRRICWLVKKGMLGGQNLSCFDCNIVTSWPSKSFSKLSQEITINMARHHDQVAKLALIFGSIFC